MSLLAFARSQKERPMRQPGQKAVSGRVASHTRLQVSSIRQDCTPWTSLKFQ